MSNLNLYCPLNTTGYGIVSKAIVQNLMGLGFNRFHLVPIGQVTAESQEEVNLINTQARVLWNREAPSIAIWHEFDLNKFSSKKLLAFPIFETTSFNHVALNYLNQMDGIIVLSSWAKEIVESSITSTVPVYVVQGASDLIEPTIQKNNVFTFFNVGKFEKRKSQVELISAYVDVFKDKKADTRLICHCFSSFEQNFVNSMHSLLGSLGLKVYNASTLNNSIIAVKGNAIVEIPKAFISKQEVFHLYKFAHMGVFPSKAEGWNLPLMEAIKVGTPCIATNYSAHTEFLNKEYNYPEELLLNTYTMETAVDGKFFHGDRGNWAVPFQNELKEKLLYSYENYEKIMSNFDNTKIKEHFTWQNTASQLIDVIRLYN